MPGHVGQPSGQAPDVLSPGLPGLTRRHLPEEVAHRIEACHCQKLAATAPIPKQVEIYVVVVVVGTLDMIERGTMVLSLMSKSNDTHGLRHSCLRPLHEEPRIIFDPLQMCCGILRHVGHSGQ